MKTYLAIALSVVILLGIGIGICRYSFLLPSCSIRDDSVLEHVKNHADFYPQYTVLVLNPVSYPSLRSTEQEEKVTAFRKEREQMLADTSKVFTKDVEVWFEPYPKEGGFGRYHFLLYDRDTGEKDHILTNINILDFSPPKLVINDQIYLYEDALIIHSRHNQRNQDVPLKYKDIVYYNYECKKGVIIELPDDISIVDPPVVRLPYIIANGLHHVITFNMSTKQLDVKRVTWSPTLQGIVYSDNTLYWSQYHDGTITLSRGFKKTFPLRTTSQDVCEYLDPISEEGEFRARSYTSLQPIWYDPSGRANLPPYDK
jgi:hypothetical protein